MHIYCQAMAPNQLTMIVSSSRLLECVFHQVTLPKLFSNYSSLLLRSLDVHLVFAGTGVQRMLICAHG
jgi:hypothetical protein